MFLQQVTIGTRTETRRAVLGEIEQDTARTPSRFMFPCNKRAIERYYAILCVVNESVYFDHI